VQIARRMSVSKQLMITTNSNRSLRLSEAQTLRGFGSLAGHEEGVGMPLFAPLADGSSDEATTITTVELLDAPTYTTIRPLSCLIPPSACAYGSEAWRFEARTAQ
jgi:hypothetical protein